MMTPVMESVWATLGRASLCAAIAFSIAWLACQALHRAPRRIHCWIWRLACLKVIVASVWIVPVAVPILPAANTQTATPVDIARAPIRETGSPLSSQGEFLPEEATPYSFKWAYVLTTGWLIGFAFFLVRSFREWKYSWRIRRDGVPCVSGPVFELYQKSAAAMGVARPPRLLESDELDVPALVGIFHPAVVVSPGLVKRVHSSELGLVLRHEIGHLKRRDLLWNLLVQAVDLTMFFHPMVWLARRRWRVSQEAACDELVLQSPGSHSKIYASALVRVAELMRQDPGPRFSAIGVVSSFRSLRERIIAMQRAAAWSRSGLLAVACGLLMVSVPGIVPWKLVTRQVAVRFVNGDFETGDTTGWTIAAGPNARYTHDGVVPFDILGPDSGATSHVFSLSAGQVANESNVYRHVEITQNLSLEKGQRYEIGFDWAVENFFPTDNFDGGVFELVVDGQPLASFDTQNIFTRSVERGTLNSVFTPSRSGTHPVGARISRRFPIPFPGARDPTLLQYLDNFTIRPAPVSQPATGPG